MMSDIKVPAVGESITEATIGSWIKKSGDIVKQGEVILSLETDKASVEVVAETDGQLTTTANEGDTVKIGAVVGKIDPSKAGAKDTAPAAKEVPAASAGKTAPSTPAAPPALVSPPAQVAPQSSSGSGAQDVHLSPAVRRVVGERGLDPSQIAGTGKGGRITKQDAMEANPTPAKAASPAKESPVPSAPARAPAPAGTIDRVPMTTIRKKIAERLVSAQQTAAILTTFNEVDMTAILDLRAKYKDGFEKRHKVRLGFMGFFVKAVIQGLKEFPAVNASIDGTDILYKNFYNIGVAVSTPKGLVVPVIKNADQMSLAEIEIKINEFAVKARDGKISIDDMADGTFTVSNGGVFGSLMSTPILNPPQSGILGMHKTEKRAVVVDDQIVIRPMMYVALSYDHRMIDGRESVSFLVRVKECLEDPSRILMEI
ncbi:MAG: 2-oxoglutarate dehydrogenase complex dihydrolipoyllysine-residue succinyltransferase [Bdellovibrionales bacterium]|nr:2-oxoglutarate dehydrogenase complex dihydrolipoyllysine-residue succinyltransferase [Bdellovibrionales bacterium]